MTRVAIFDLDGTLMDSPQAIVRTFAAAFEAMGVAPRDPADVRATIGLPLEQAFADLLGVSRGDARVAEGVALYQEAFRTVVLPRAAELVFPGVAEGLAELRHQGITLAVATSKFHASADALLGAAGLRDCFTVLIGADDVTHPKPHPESALTILTRCAVGPERAVAVGDTSHDLLMARAAGIRSIAVTYGVHTRSALAAAAPSYIADSFEEVVAHLVKELPPDGRARTTSTPVVDRLLGDGSRHIEFNGHLTDHIKHAVVALAGLGVDPRRIEEYHDAYVSLTSYGFRVEPARPARRTIDDGNWLELLGRRTDFAAYCAFFDRRERELGLPEVLRRYLPHLLPGWVGALTHATIHLGWALDAGSRRMTIEGLAYLAFGHVSCHPERAFPATAHDDKSPLDSLMRIATFWEDNRQELADWAENLVGDTSPEALADINPELLRSGIQYRIARMHHEGHPLIYETPFLGHRPGPHHQLERSHPPDHAALSGGTRRLPAGAPDHLGARHAAHRRRSPRRPAPRGGPLPLDGLRRCAVLPRPLPPAAQTRGAGRPLRHRPGRPGRPALDTGMGLADRAGGRGGRGAQPEAGVRHARDVVPERRTVPLPGRGGPVHHQAGPPHHLRRAARRPGGLIMTAPTLSVEKYLGTNVHLLPQTHQLRALHTLVRDRNARREDFVLHSGRIIRMLIEAGLNLLPFEPYDVHTPVGSTYPGLRLGAELCGVPVIRAGESMETELRAVCPGIPIGKILIQRDPTTKLPRLYYTKLPTDIADRHVLLLDPMLATGGTAMASIELLLEHGVGQGHIVFVNFITVPEGITAVCERFPEVRIVTSSIEQRLNENAYMVPGIGDFGDRYFGTDG